MTSSERYEKHLQSGSEPSFREMLQRICFGGASSEDLIRYIRWEMREALFSLPPDPADQPRGRAVDGFHASCCVERADASMRQLERLLATGASHTPVRVIHG